MDRPGNSRPKGAREKQPISTDVEGLSLRDPSLPAPTVGRMAQDRIGLELRGMYAELERQPLPRRVLEVPDGGYAATLRSAPDQQSHLDFEDLRAALAKLPPDQREALLLVGAQGFSYEDAAVICGCAIGTVKSRVNRARKRLAELMFVEDLDDLALDGVTAAA